MTDKAEKIAEHISGLIVKTEILQRFRNKCREFAQLHRMYCEADNLWHFEVSVYFETIKHFKELQKKNIKPDRKMAIKYIAFMKRHFGTYIKEHHGRHGEAIITDEDMYAIYINPKDIKDFLESLDPDNWSWEWHTITNGNAGDYGRIKESIEGWRLPFKNPKPSRQEIPWPYYIFGSLRQNIDYRALDPERDLSAMYALLALCHDCHDSEPQIINNETAKICPDIRDLVSFRPDTIVEMAEMDKDLDKALMYIEEDLKNFTADNEGQESKQEKNIRHSPVHVAPLESPRKAGERNISKSESIKGTLGEFQELARQEADKILEDNPVESPFDHLLRLNDYFQDAFSRAVVIAEWSRQDDPGDDLYLRGLGYFPGFAIFCEIFIIKENLERAESLRKQIPNFHIIWARDKDVTFGGCVGMSAFDAALIFSHIILSNSFAAWNAIKGNHPDNDYLSLKYDPPDPLLMEWMNTTHKYLREEVLPPPEAWPKQQIRLDYNTLLSQICHEGERALKNIQAQMDNDNQKNLPEQAAASEKKLNIQKEKDIRHSPVHVAPLESAQKADERNISKSTDIQEPEKVLQILLHAIEKHRLTFLYFAGAERINPSIPPNGRREALNKDDFRHNEIPVKDKDKDDDGDFLFKYRYIMDGFAQKAVSQFGTGPGIKPKIMTKDGKWLEVEGCSYPFWRLDEDACEYLEKTGDTILEACKQLLETDTTGVYHALSEQAMNVIHDNDQPRWYSSVLVKWEYLLRLDETIASLKKGKLEIITKKSINILTALGGTSLPIFAIITNSYTIELSKITDKKDKQSSNANDDSEEGKTVNINQLSNYESAKRLAEVYELPVKNVRSVLSKAYWGPGGTKTDKPTNPFLRVSVDEAGSRDTKYLWDTKLAKPILDNIKKKHEEKHKK